MMMYDDDDDADNDNDGDGDDGDDDDGDEARLGFRVRTEVHRRGNADSSRGSRAEDSVGSRVWGWDTLHPGAASTKMEDR